MTPQDPSPAPSAPADLARLLDLYESTARAVGLAIGARTHADVDEKRAAAARGLVDAAFRALAERVEAGVREWDKERAEHVNDVACGERRLLKVEADLAAALSRAEAAEAGWKVAQDEAARLQEAVIDVTRERNNAEARGRDVAAALRFELARSLAPPSSPGGTLEAFLGSDNIRRDPGIPAPLSRVRQPCAHRQAKGWCVCPEAPNCEEVFSVALAPSPSPAPDPIWTTTACPHCGGEVDGIRVLTETEIGRPAAGAFASEDAAPLIDNGRGQIVYAPTDEQAREADAFIRSRLSAAPLSPRSETTERGGPTP